MVVIAFFSYLCFKDQLGLCLSRCDDKKIVLRASEYLLTRCEWFLRREEIPLNLPEMAFCYIIQILSDSECLFINLDFGISATQIR